MKEINLGKCKIVECCGHYFPWRVLKEKNELKDGEKEYHRYDVRPQGALKDFADQEVEIIIRTFDEE